MSNHEPHAARIIERLDARAGTPSPTRKQQPIASGCSGSTRLGEAAL